MRFSIFLTLISLGLLAGTGCTSKESVASQYKKASASSDLSDGNGEETGEEVGEEETGEEETGEEATGDEAAGLELINGTCKSCHDGKTNPVTLDASAIEKLDDAPSQPLHASFKEYFEAGSQDRLNIEAALNTL